VLFKLRLIFQSKRIKKWLPKHPTGNALRLKTFIMDHDSWFKDGPARDAGFLARAGQVPVVVKKWVGPESGLDL